MGHPLLKIAPSHADLEFPQPTQVINPNGILIGSAFLQRSLVPQTIRETGGQTTLLDW